jgi:aspartyl-tRNA(Asn)/glutamyl-tRNA(Gln) amidotransferase subunit A
MQPQVGAIGTDFSRSFLTATKRNFPVANLVGRPVPGTIHGAADALAAGDLSAVYLSLDPEQVLADAANADKQRKAGNVGRLAGIPIAIKDNLNVIGQPCTCASKLLKGYESPYDATAVARLKAAGMIPCGRTNMDEFAMGSSTEHSAYGLARNPQDTDRVPGGSSGGSAVVVAAGSAMAALGSDTGGSIRQPAAFCGVVGLKPSYGRVSRYGLTAFASSLDQIGPITADVRDAALLLDVIGGHDHRDSTSLPEDCSGFENAVTAVNDDTIAGLTFGLPKQYLATAGLQPEIRASIESTCDKIKAAGGKVVEVDLPHTDHAVATYYVIATAEASSNLARFDGIRYGARVTDGNPDLLDTYYQSREQGFGDEVKRRIILGTYVLSSGYYDAYYLRAQKVRTLIRNDFETAFQSCDVILGPTAPTTAFKVGEVTDPITMYLADIFTIPVNLVGNCAISIPAGKDDAGMPIGLQLAAPNLAEARLLQAATALGKLVGGR